MHTGVNVGQSVVDAGQSSVDARMQAACIVKYAYCECSITWPISHIPQIL